MAAITPQQRAAICDPNDLKLISSIQLNPQHVVFQTLTNTTSANITTANTTIGTQAPPSATSIAPSAVA
jgi:hypothetical protein